MNFQKLISVAILCIFSHLAFSQTPFNIDTTRRCLYSGVNFVDLYAFSDEDPFVEDLVQDICRIMKKDRGQFTLRNAIVPNVAAVIDGKNKYLLYNQIYFYDNRSNTTICKAILAHEIGHLFSSDKLDGRHRVREETAADAFMAEAIMRLDSTSKVENALAIIKSEPFSYAKHVEWADREEAIRKGWKTASALMTGPGFGINTSNAEDFPLPRFNLKGCPKSSIISNPRFLNKKLSAIDNCLVTALASKGYTEHSYFCVKNGFALVSGLERFYDSGVSISDDTRFQDCPHKERFTGVYDYILKCFYPKPTRMRMFVFIINDQPNPEYEPGCLKGDEPKEWLLKGGGWLPESIGEKVFTKNFKVRAMVFEFTVPESNKKPSEQCTKPLKVEIHLEKSGLLAAINKNI